MYALGNKYISHEVIIFWIGLLTGAIIVGFVFLFQFIATVELQNAALKNASPIKTPSKVEQRVAPKGITSPGIRPAPEATVRTRY